MSANNTNDPERSAMQLLQDINSGIIDPKQLDKPSRQRCVEVLWAEGYTYPQINQVLKISEKTIGRDMKEIKARNELTPNIDFAKQFIGEVFQKAMNSHSFLVRLARSKDATNPEKIQAEFAAWRLLKELVERMQSLGYLPLRPQQIVGDVFHHMSAEDGDETLEEVKTMVSEIELVAKDTNTFTPELAEEIKDLNCRIEKAEIVSDVKKIAEKQKETQDKEDTKDEQPK